MTRLFCRHSWEKVAEQTFPSVFEQLQTAGPEVMALLKRVDPDMFERRYILVLKCLKCGRIHTTFTAIR